MEIKSDEKNNRVIFESDKGFRLVLFKEYKTVNLEVTPTSTTGEKFWHPLMTFSFEELKQLDLLVADTKAAVVAFEDFTSKKRVRK